MKFFGKLKHSEHLNFFYKNEVNKMALSTKTLSKLEVSEMTVTKGHKELPIRVTVS